MSSSTSTGAGPSLGTGLPGAPMNLSKRSRPVESVIKVLLFGSAMLSVLITFGIIVALIRPVIDFFGEIPLGDFFSFDEGQSFAVGPLISATMVTTVIALLVAVPPRLGGAK